MNLINIKSFSLIVAISSAFLQPAFALGNQIEDTYEWSNAGTENGSPPAQDTVCNDSKSCGDSETTSSMSISIVAGAAAIAAFALVAIASAGKQIVQVPGRTKYVSNTMYLRPTR